MADTKAAALASRLETAHERLVAVLRLAADDRWRAIPMPGVWSASKDAAHVIEATAYHEWIVRKTIGEKVPSERPAMERTQLTSHLSRREAVALLGQRTNESVRLLATLTDAQLDLRTRPPRANGQRLATTIERVLIGHYDAHRTDIEAKLRT